MKKKYPIKQYSPSAVFLKEPIEKRWYLARYFTSLVSVTFFTKRKRGDGGNSGRAIRTFSENNKNLILQDVIEYPLFFIPLRMSPCVIHCLHIIIFAIYPTPYFQGGFYEGCRNYC